MTSPAKLLRHYNTRLVANATVLALVSSVAGDDTIDYVKSAKTVRATARALTSVERADAFPPVARTLRKTDRSVVA